MSIGSGSGKGKTGTYGAVRQDAQVELDTSSSRSSRSENSRCLCMTEAANSIGARLFPLGYWREFRELLRLHLPAFLTCFFQFFLQTISVIICGHLSKEELDAVALACTLINVAGLGIGVGLATGCDTYFAQTYGSSSKKRCGLYLQRSLIVMYMALVPVYCLHLNIRPVLLLLGQDERVSEMTAQYVLLFMPGVFFDFTFLVLARYLQTQNRLTAPLICAFIGNLFNAVSQYVAIFVMGFRYEASAICQAASLAVMCLCLIAYILYSRVYEETWSGWSREAWYDLGGFVRLAVPGLLFVGLEEISFEIGTFIAGAISTLQLAAQGIVFQSATLSYMVSLGMSIAVNIRVGQHLGAGKQEAARHTYRVAATISICISATFVLLFAIGSRAIASLFTSDLEVLNETSEVLQVYAGFPLVDGLSATGSGVLKGCGKQLSGAVINVIAYYGLAMPIGIPLSLMTSLKVKGMWIGLLAALSLETLVFWVIIWRIDWDKQVAEAQARAAGVTVDKLANSFASSKRNAVSELEESQPLLVGHSRSSSLSSRAKFQPSDIEVRVVSPADNNSSTSLPPLRSILPRRLVTISLLLAALTAAICVRLAQSPLAGGLLPIDGNSTVLNATVYGQGL